MSLTDAQKRAAALREEKIRVKQEDAHDGLRGLLQKNPRSGGVTIDHSGSGNSPSPYLSLDESIDSIIGKLDHALQDFSEGEWNGIPIKNGEMMDKHRVSLEGLLEVATAVSRAVSVKGRTKKFELGDNSTRQFGQYDFDLFVADKKIISAYDRWEKSVFQHVSREDIVLPRSIKCIETNAQHGEFGLYCLIDLVYDQQARSFTKPTPESLDIAFKFLEDEAKAEKKGPAVPGAFGL